MTNGNTRGSAIDEPGLGTQRYVRYKAAFTRVIQSAENGYYLEAIAILDSLISDRLASRLGYVVGSHPSERLTCGQVCRSLLELTAEQNPDFRDEVQRVLEWTARRNAAIHATAKTLKSKGGQSFEELLESYRDVLFAGVERLRAFDALDVADRKKNAARPAATEPGAFAGPR